MAEAQAGSGTQSGILGWIERSGNKLPDPVFLFFWLIAILVVISIVASLTGLSAAHPRAMLWSAHGIRIAARVSVSSISRYVGRRES